MGKGARTGKYEATGVCLNVGQEQRNILPYINRNNFIPDAIYNTFYQAVPMLHWERLLLCYSPHYLFHIVSPLSDICIYG